MLLRFYTKRSWDAWRSHDAQGQTLVDYVLLLTFITLVVVATVAVVGAITSGFYFDFGTTYRDS